MPTGLDVFQPGQHFRRLARGNRHMHAGMTHPVGIGQQRKKRLRRWNGGDPLRSWKILPVPPQAP
jgi:hypothetical protein